MTMKTSKVLVKLLQRAVHAVKPQGEPCVCVCVCAPVWYPYRCAFFSVGVFQTNLFFSAHPSRIPTFMPSKRKVLNHPQVDPGD